MIRKAFVDDVRDKVIYIYGAGSYGKIIFNTLNEMNINVEGFIDEGAVTIKNFYNKKILSPKDAFKHISQDSYVLLASLNHMEDMISVMKSYNYYNYYSAQEILELSVNRCSTDEYEKEITKNIERYKRKIQALNDTKLVISNVDLVITERCTLRCKGCGSLMPEYRARSVSPEDIDVDSIICCFDRYIQAIDELLELRILGGETFLYPHLDKLLKHYSSENKIKEIVLFTNATILPKAKDVEVMKNKNVLLHISDYGEISEKKDELIALCRREKIRFFIHTYSVWRDMGELKKYNRSEDEKMLLFKMCDNKNCSSFYRGKLYICPRAAHGERIGVFCNLEEDVVDFMDDSCSREEKREKLLKFLRRNNFIACDYCKGNNVHNKEIRAAVQN